VLPVDFGGLEDEFDKGLGKQGFDIAFFPVTRGRVRLGHGFAAQGNRGNGHIVFFQNRQRRSDADPPAAVAMTAAACCG
jgi:hypothetical protein